MSDVTLEHFKRAAIEIGAHGDNDTLPFDIDNRFIKDKSSELAEIAFHFFQKVNRMDPKSVLKTIGKLQIFSERLLVPSGPYGFRITTKIHPFWNIYLNGLGIAIAEKLEVSRDDKAHSYRFAHEGKYLFDKNRSWRSFREATLADDELNRDGSVVVQTDISSFYEHIYHHRLENCINDIFPNSQTISIQIDRILNKLSSGRSFGLPVGGQCSRVLAELLMCGIDQMLNDEGLTWHRYVDDYVLIANSQEEAYEALSVLSHSLADYGLSLNKSKTTILSGKHYNDYVRAQLGTNDAESRQLREIDIHFDPYSDSPEDDYHELKKTVSKLDVQALLDLEQNKSQPDTFLISQVSRTLRFHPPKVAIQLCQTLLDVRNLHSFRASWSTIMRGVSTLRSKDEFKIIFDDLDKLIDNIPVNSSHLLHAEASSLHYLKTIRFKHNDERAKFVLKTDKTTESETVKRSCIDCWRNWIDRKNFTKLRSRWDKLGTEEQRMIWLAFAELGDEGKHARKQLFLTISNSCALGIETNRAPSFFQVYKDWSENGV